jgi:hypothetical protein
LDEETVSYQGAAEIAAFHIDRVLGLNKKPYTVGRMFSEQEMASIGPFAKRRWFFLRSDQTLARVSLQQWIPYLQSGVLPTREHFQV